MMYTMRFSNPTELWDHAFCYLGSRASEEKPDYILLPKGMKEPITDCAEDYDDCEALNTLAKILGFDLNFDDCWDDEGDLTEPIFKRPAPPTNIRLQFPVIGVFHIDSENWVLDATYLSVMAFAEGHINNDNNANVVIITNDDC